MSKEKKFLEEYGGQSTAELLAMEATHRVDSLVLAFEQAIDQKRAMTSSRRSRRRRGSWSGSATRG